MTEADSERGAAGPGAEWALRPWVTAGLLGLAGLAIHLVTQGRDDVPWQMATAAFLFFGAIAAAFTLDEDNWKAPGLFALAVGAVMAGLAWRAVGYGESLPDEQYGFAAGLVATALALPLFQADFHRRRLATPYGEIYGHVWTDAISAAGALAFTGAAWLVLVLMAELFHLLKIDVLREVIDEGWLGWTFSGVAAGAALGTLRNQLKVLATLQTVVLLVASLLAVPLAAGLALFLLATAVSGPQVLWEATRSATPLLLGCAAGAFVLTNAIARQSDEAMTRSRVMRVAGWTLAAVILPLAVFAAVSMGLRLGQYGLAPERLWGLVAIVVACVCGIGYWAALVRGRKLGWTGYLRKATFHLALGVCGFALLLALPILDFGAISTRNQVARLEQGRVTPGRFDFTALQWDFGEPGRRALRRLATSTNALIKEKAVAALARDERPYFVPEPERFTGEFWVFPRGRTMPDGLQTAIIEKANVCHDELLCRVYLQPDAKTVVVVGDDCARPGMTGEDQVSPSVKCNVEVTAMAFEQGVWAVLERTMPPSLEMSAERERESLQRERDAIERGDVTVGPAQLRQIFIDGKPVNQPFD
ncbi:MAG: hypothetical protein B7Z08_12930 [Sphingomonadales bacterium 32-68-7]|nr:MAG: hypothetical protein B7Z08_12930 [Sphingomonadales bacterium 32-68-7]